MTQSDPNFITLYFIIKFPKNDEIPRVQIGSNDPGHFEVHSGPAVFKLNGLLLDPKITDNFHQRNLDETS